MAFFLAVHPSDVVYMEFIKLHISIKDRKVFLSHFVTEYRSGNIHMHIIILSHVDSILYCLII